MAEFKLPENLSFDRAPIHDPSAYAREGGCTSWFYLCGKEFASMEGGISYDHVWADVAYSANGISDPPRVLYLQLARQHVKALDELPRPTLITCRAGPWASAVAFMYAGLKQRADPDEVLAAAERDASYFASFPSTRTG